MPIIQYFLIATLHLLILLFFVIAFRKDKPESDKWLLCWLVFIFFHLVSLFISLHSNYNRNFNHITFCLAIVHGPFLYLYTNTLTKKITVFRPILLLHFTPTVICFLLLGVTKDYETSYFIDYLVSIVSLFIYVVLSLKRMRKYQRDIKNLYSNVDQISYNWLKYIIIGILLILIIGVASFVMYYWMEVTIPFTLIFSIVMLLFCGFLVYKNIIDRIVHTEEYQVTDKELSDGSYQTSKLTNQDLQKLAKSIKQYIKEDSPYLKMDLKLNDVALALDTYPHHITEVLNTVFKRNFNDFINLYRVEEAKQQLLDTNNNNVTIVAIAYDCGFNSKSSFYRIFKQSTGLTPTEYIKEQQY